VLSFISGISDFLGVSNISPDSPLHSSMAYARSIFLDGALFLIGA